MRITLEIPDEELIEELDDAHFRFWDHVGNHSDLLTALTLLINTESEEFEELVKRRLVKWGIVGLRPDFEEELLEKYIDFVDDWDNVSRFAPLSPEFVEKHIDKITEAILENPVFEEYPDSLKLLLKQKFNK